MNRTEKLAIPLTPDEKKLIGLAAKTYDLKAAAYARRCLLRRAKQRLEALKTQEEQDRQLLSKTLVRPVSTAAWNEFVSRTDLPEKPAVLNKDLLELLQPPSKNRRTPVSSKKK